MQLVYECCDPAHAFHAEFHGPGNRIFFHGVIENHTSMLPCERVVGEIGHIGQIPTSLLKRIVISFGRMKRSVRLAVVPLVALLAGCGTPPPREFPYGAPGSGHATIPEAGQLFKEIFEAFDEADFLAADQWGAPGNAAGMEVDAKKGVVSFQIRLYPKRPAYREWAEAAKRKLGPLSRDYEKDKPGKPMRKNVIHVDGWRFEMPETWAPIMEASLQAVPPRRSVRICLSDADDFTIAEQTVPTSLFAPSPLHDFCALDPAYATITFRNLTYNQITKASKAICQVGEREVFFAAFAETANAYRKAHPATSVRLPGDIPLVVENLTPYFGIGRYEVTQEQWESVMGTNPSWKSGAKLPVENVSCDDCEEFFRKANALPEVRKAGVTLRLPTIDEWRAACRAGSPGAYGRLADGTERRMEEMGWYAANSGGCAHAVGGKQPNAFGLYDMHGNVAEWGQDSSLASRFALGGSYKDDTGKCQSDSIVRTASGARSGSVGLRVAVSFSN